MHQSINRTISIMLLAALLATSCSGGGNGSEASGDMYESAAGGFSFRKIDGYLLQEAGGVVSISAPDAEGELGPMIMMMGGSTDAEKDNETLLEEISADTDVMSFSKGKKLTVNGTKGLIAEGEAEYGDSEMRGELFVAMVTPTQSFSLIGFAPAERWKELRPVITEVLDSITFFEPYGSGAGAAGFADNAGPSMAAGDDRMYQWASEATASSEYSNPDWAAFQATGAPDVDTCGDDPKAWAPLEGDTEEWIELSYDVPVIPSEINIYQSYNPSQVVEVQIVDVNGDVYVAWSGEPEAVSNCPDLMTITLELYEEIYIDKVVIFVDQSVMGWGWVEIDAVELVGMTSTAQTAAGPAAGQPPSSAGTANLPDPNLLAANSFTFSISGYENDVVNSNLVDYQSTEQTYVVGMYNDNWRYIVSLFIPKDEIRQGNITLAAYDQTLANKGYTAAIYINAFLYMATEGELNIMSDPATGKLTATYTFEAVSKDYPDRMITVTGALKDIPLN